MAKITSGEFVANTTWKVLEVVSTKLLGLIVSTILARIISPESYGVLSLCLVFLATFEFLTNSITTGIIMKKEVDQSDYSTSMIVNLIISAVLYLIVYFLAPLFGKIYNSTDFIYVVRVLSTILFAQGFSNVIKAKATVELKTKRTAFSTFVSSILSGGLGIVCAYKGLGVWALVVQNVVYTFADALIVTLLIKWNFKINFSFEKMKYYLTVGAHIASANIINALNNNICSLIGGSVYTKTDIGYSSKGNQYAEIVGLYAFNTINSFSIVAISSRQDDKEKVKETLRRILSMTMYIVAPIMLGLFAISNTLIPVWLTDIWIPAIPFFQIACIRFLINPIGSLATTAIRGMGDNKTCTLLSAISAMMTIATSVIITLVLRKSILFATAFGLIVTVLYGVVAFLFLNKKISYTFKELMTDLYKPIILSLIMVALVKAVELMPISLKTALLIQIFVGAISYIVLSILTNNKDYLFLKNYILEKIKR